MGDDVLRCSLVPAWAPAPRRQRSDEKTRTIESLGEDETKSHGRDTSECGPVLIVDDDFVLRSALAELLMNEGFRVEAAADGFEALHRLNRDPVPSAIITDIVMPLLDGARLRELQLQSRLIAHIPVIAITALRDLTPLQAMGFHSILRKPLDTEWLVEVLDEICSRLQ